MINIVVIGTGNVALHLVRAFEKSNATNVLQVYGRSSINTLEGVPVTNSIGEIKEADIYIIAIPDDAITAVSQKLKNKNGLVVHTSGSVPMEALSHHSRYGVFYPLQTFSKKVEMDFEEVPICIEAKQKADLDLLSALGGHISKNVREISSEQRKSLHLAAVFVNNFTNHLYHIGATICRENNLPFELLKPLVLETTKKLGASSPYDAQTGPAVRGDKSTMEHHLNQLKNKTHKEIYALMSQSISNTYGKEL